MDFHACLLSDIIPILIDNAHFQSIMRDEFGSARIGYGALARKVAGDSDIFRAYVSTKRIMPAHPPPFSSAPLARAGLAAWERGRPARIAALALGAMNAASRRLATGVKSASRKAGSTLAPLIAHGEKIRPLSAQARGRG